MKKIVFLINTLNIGGAEHALIDIANALDKKVFDVTIKTIYDSNSFSDLVHEKVKIDSYYKTKKNSLIDKVCRKVIYLKLKHFSNKRLYKLLIKEKYDIEVAFLEGLPTKIIAGSTSTAKKIAWVHCDFKINNDSDYFFKNFEEQKETYQKYDEIYCVSENSKKSFEKRFNIKKNTFVMHNIIDEKTIKQKSLEKAELSNDFNIISVGRLTEQKAYERLVEAYSKALNIIKIKTHLYIIGEGEERNKIETTIKKYKLEKQISLLGRQNNPYKYVGKCQLYVCSSKSEGYPLVIQEALALGIPILSTNCLNSEELFNGENFGLVVENSIEGITKGLIQLVNNNSELCKIKKEIQKKYQQENSIEKIQSQLLK